MSFSKRLRDVLLSIREYGFFFIDCPDPALTEASELNPSQTAVQLRQFDNDFTVSCKNGYSFQSDELNLRSARMKCMYGGKWLVEQRTRTIPQCKRELCAAFDYLTFCYFEMYDLSVLIQNIMTL